MCDYPTYRKRKTKLKRVNPYKSLTSATVIWLKQTGAYSIELGRAIVVLIPMQTTRWPISAFLAKWEYVDLHQVHAYIGDKHAIFGSRKC